MGYLIKLVCLPFGAALVFLNNALGALHLPQWLSTTLDIGALGVLFAGFLIIARYRALAEVEAKASDAWRDRYDAAQSRCDDSERHLAEVQQQVEDQRIALAKLQALPDMRLLMAMLEEHDAKAMERFSELVRQIRENGGEK